jgi:hypothetical protein
LTPTKFEKLNAPDMTIGLVTDPALEGAAPAEIVSNVTAAPPKKLILIFIIPPPEIVSSLPPLN